MLLPAMSGALRPVMCRPWIFNAPPWAISNNALRSKPITGFSVLSAAARTVIGRSITMIFSTGSWKKGHHEPPVEPQLEKVPPGPHLHEPG